MRYLLIFLCGLGACSTEPPKETKVVESTYHLDDARQLWDQAFTLLDSGERGYLDKSEVNRKTAPIIAKADSITVHLSKYDQEALKDYRESRLSEFIDIKVKQ